MSSLGESEAAPVNVTLSAALDGDATAWRELVSQHNNLLWWIARSYRLDQDTAADVVQTVWLQVIRYGRTIQRPDRFASWLATTARRECLSRTKDARRMQTVESFPDIDDPVASEVPDRMLDEELVGDALRAFRLLDAPCQQLLRLLCVVPALSYAEVAGRLHKSPGYIGPTRARCLARLRVAMAATEPDGLAGRESRMS